jgi:hypothetical protein
MIYNKNIVLYSGWNQNSSMALLNKIIALVMALVVIMAVMSTFPAPIAGRWRFRSIIGYNILVLLL